MGKWDLGSDDDEPNPKVIDNPNFQEGQGSWMDDENENMCVLEKPSIHRDHDPGKCIEDLGHSKAKLDDDITDVEWDISTPNIKPPHNEWPVNTEELGILMPKADFVKFAKQVFNDPSLWLTKSWMQDKYTISKVTHAGIAAHWQQRFREFAPNKVNVKMNSVYPPFLRCLIAEFILKWKVDYRWENEGGKLTHAVHKSVLAIATNRNKAGGKDILASSSKKGSKRKMDDVQKLPTQQVAKATGIPAFFMKPEPTPGPINMESSQAKRPHTGAIGSSIAHASIIDDPDPSKETFNMQNVCKSLGVEVGDFIEKNLRTKYLVEQLESSAIEKYKSQLQEAEMKIKSLERMRAEPSGDSQVMHYKVLLYDKIEEIKALEQQLLDKSGHSNQVAKLEEKDKVISDLQNQVKSQDAIIKDLHGQLQWGDNGNSGKEKLELIPEDFVHMQIIDPTGQNTIFPDVEVDGEAVERFFDK